MTAVYPARFMHCTGVTTSPSSPYGPNGEVHPGVPRPRGGAGRSPDDRVSLYTYAIPNSVGRAIHALAVDLDVDLHDLVTDLLEEATRDRR